MVKSDAIIRAGPKYLGTPYGKMDCQAFVEKCLEDAGIRMNLSGSNAWYREVMQHGWVGTPEECRKAYGGIPPGAFLFIWKSSGEPAKYQGDGIGNASHIGIYTGMTGKEMCDMSGKDGADRYDYGNGAINSSNSRGCVCTSKFSGKSISGGWNRVGLWTKMIDYFGDEQHMQETYEATVIGGALNLRKKPAKNSDRITQIPEGAIVIVLDECAGWSQVAYDKYQGYAMSEYLDPIQQGTDEKMISVSAKDMQAIYDMIGKMLKG